MRLAVEFVIKIEMGQNFLPQTTRQRRAKGSTRYRVPCSIQGNQGKCESPEGRNGDENWRQSGARSWAELNLNGIKGKK